MSLIIERDTRSRYHIAIYGDCQTMVISNQARRCSTSDSGLGDPLRWNKR